MCWNLQLKISITNVVMKIFILLVLVVSQISQQVQLLHHTTVRFPATTLLFWMIIPTLQRFVKHKIFNFNLNSFQNSWKKSPTYILKYLFSFKSPINLGQPLWYQDTLGIQQHDKKKGAHSTNRLVRNVSYEFYLMVICIIF